MNVVFFLITVVSFGITRGQLSTYLLLPLQNYLPKLPSINQILPIPTTVLPKPETNGLDDDFDPPNNQLSIRPGRRRFPSFVTSYPQRVVDKIQTTSSIKTEPTKSRTTFPVPSTTTVPKNLANTHAFEDVVTPEDDVVTDEPKKSSVDSVREGIFKNPTDVYPDNIPEELSRRLFITYPPTKLFVGRPIELPENGAARQPIQEAVKNGELGARNYLKAIPRIKYSDTLAETN